MDSSAEMEFGESRPAAEVREEHKEELLKALHEHPGFRVKFAKTVVRLGVKFPDGRWHLATCYLLAREYTQAASLMKDQKEHSQ